MASSLPPSLPERNFLESELIAYCRAFRQEEESLTPGGMFRFYRTGFFVIAFYTAIEGNKPPEQRMFALPPALSDIISRLWILGETDWDVIFVDFDNWSNHKLSYHESAVVKGMEQAVMEVIQKVRKDKDDKDQ